MARLSNNTREQMAAALVKHRFDETAIALVAEAQDLFRNLYDEHYDADTRKHMAAIGKKFAKAFSRDDSITANVNGRVIEVGAVAIGNSHARWTVQVESRPVLQDLQGYRSYVGITEDHALAARLIAFGDGVEALREQIEPARREALGALQQFTTGKKLAEEWPEAMPVIGSLIPEDDRTLPVIQVNHLNGKFGLPPSAKLAA